MPELGSPPEPTVRQLDGQHVCYADNHADNHANTGEGERTLVLLHPIGLDWRSWLPTMLWFPTRLRVLAVDLRGFGGSGPGPPVSLASHARDLAALLVDLRLTRVHVAGLSYGGAVAATFACQHPGLVESLAIVAAPTTANREMFLARADAAEQGGHDSYLAPTIERWFRSETVVLRPATAEYAATRLRATPVSHWAAGWRVLSETDLLDDLASIRVPTAVVAGEHDAGFPPEDLARVAAHIPGATFHTVPGVAHMIGLEAPFQLASVLYRNVLRASG
jgi:3-oxoadipate enol-lactonase